MQSAAVAAALALVRHAERTWQLSLDQTLTHATSNKQQQASLVVVVGVVVGDQHRSVGRSDTI